MWVTLCTLYTIGQATEEDAGMVKGLPKRVALKLFGGVIRKTHFRATSCTRLRARDRCTSSTLVGRNSGSQSKFTSGDSQGTDGGCRVCVDSYMASNGSCFVGIYIVFENHLLGGRFNTKLGDCGTPNVHNRWFILVLSRVRAYVIRISLK
jgi:hypothetical protein